MPCSNLWVELFSIHFFPFLTFLWFLLVKFSPLYPFGTNCCVFYMCFSTVSTLKHDPWRTISIGVKNFLCLPRSFCKKWQSKVLQTKSRKVVGSFFRPVDWVKESEVHVYLSLRVHFEFAFEVSFCEKAVTWKRTRPSCLLPRSLLKSGCLPF